MTYLKISSRSVFYELPCDVLAVERRHWHGGVAFPLSVRRPSVQGGGCSVSYPGVGNKPCGCHNIMTMMINKKKSNR